jgi:hypothetical protein
VGAVVPAVDPAVKVDGPVDLRQKVEAVRDVDRAGLLPKAGAVKVAPVVKAANDPVALSK